MLHCDKMRWTAGWLRYWTLDFEIINSHGQPCHAILFLLKYVFSPHLNTNQLELPFLTCDITEIYIFTVTDNSIPTLFFLVPDDCALCSFLDQFLLESFQGWDVCLCLPVLQSTNMKPVKLIDNLTIILIVDP